MKVICPDNSVLFNGMTHVLVRGVHFTQSCATFRARLSAVARSLGEASVGFRVPDEYTVIVYKKPTIENRFWQKVDKTGPCWIWTGSTNKAGYGQFNTKNNRPMLSHRFSYTLANGNIPDGLHVLHRCDNPPCVNPDHLFIGTQQDNMDDKRNKGRLPVGESHWRSKLTGDQVQIIRQRARCGERVVELAKAFGVSQSTVSAIVSRKMWNHMEVLP